jgi:hypothetical protein
MGFVERAFTLPGSTPPPPGSPANPIAQAGVPPAVAAPPTPAPVAAPPPPPQIGAGPTAAPPPPAQFQPGSAPGARQRASIGAATLLGAGATGGQTARKTLLGQ